MNDSFEEWVAYKSAVGKPKKSSQPLPLEEAKEPQPSQLDKERERQELRRLMEESKFNPYDFLGIRSPDGQVEVVTPLKQVSFLFYTVHKGDRRLVVDWARKTKGRFEMIKRQKLLSKGKTVDDLKQAVEEVKSAIKKMEEIAGQALYLR